MTNCGLSPSNEFCNPHIDHLADGLVQPVLSVALSIALWIRIEAPQLSAFR